MHPHDRGVDHLHLAAVSCHDSIHQPIPNAGFAPPIEAVVGGRIGAVSLGHIAPRRTGTQNPEDAIEDLSIVLWLRSAPIHRQQRLYDAPLEVGQIVAHDPSSNVGTLESPFRSTG